MNNWVEQIKAVLNAGTQSAADKKNDLWNSIEKQIKEGNMKKKRGHIGKVIAAVVAVGLVVTAFTPMGQAAIGSIADLFAPERSITLDMEGMQENTEQQLHVGTQQDEDGVTYVLYVDEERYDFVASEAGDKIVPKDFPSNLPEVSMQVMQDANAAPEAVAAQLREGLGSQYKIVKDTEAIEKPLDAIRVKALTGYEGDDAVVEYYLVDNTQGGTFIITLKYFVEAEEGHGARFEQMLGEFSIVSAKQAQ